MSDFDRDLKVDRLLNDVGDAVGGYLNPPGADAVYATVRQRRRNRAVAVGVLAVALAGGPTVGFVLASGDRAQPPSGDRPSATASAAPPSPSDPASPSPSASPTPAAPDGRISLAELKRAKPHLPAWPASARPKCKQGKGVEFVGKPVYTDVDGDGAEETAAWLWCQGTGEYKVSKVVVFDRDATGTVVTLGQVLETPSGGDEGVGAWKVWEIQPTDDGHIRVDVGDYWPCCGTAPDLPQHQWRTYGWDGQRFVQTGGPTAFGPNPKTTDLRVTAHDLVMTKQTDGTWRGTLTVTARNKGPVPAETTVTMSRLGQLSAAGNGWDTCLGRPDPQQPYLSVECGVGTLAAGESRTLTLALTSTVRPSGTIDVSVAKHRAGEDGYYPDRNGDDNEVKVAVRAG